VADPRVVQDLDDIVRDLDLLVFALERTAPEAARPREQERRRVRVELERLRDRLADVTRTL